MPNDDLALLHEYARNNSEEVFAAVEQQREFLIKPAKKLKYDYKWSRD